MFANISVCTGKFPLTFTIVNTNLDTQWSMQNVHIVIFQLLEFCVSVSEEFTLHLKFLPEYTRGSLEETKNIFLMEMAAMEEEMA